MYSIIKLSSIIIFTFETIPKKEDTVFLTLISVLLFYVSIVVILTGHDNNILYKIPY